METRTVDVHDAQAQLADLLSLVAAGVEVILTDGTTPVARLISPERGQPRASGLHPEAFWTSDDFDEPLPDEFWTGTR